MLSKYTAVVILTLLFAACTPIDMDKDDSQITLSQYAEYDCRMHFECHPEDIKGSLEASVNNCIIRLKRFFGPQKAEWERAGAGECWDERLLMFKCYTGTNCEEYNSRIEERCKVESDNYVKCMDSLAN